MQVAERREDVNEKVTLAPAAVEYEYLTEQKPVQ
jgi:hypothetical protein